MAELMGDINFPDIKKQVLEQATKQISDAEASLNEKIQSFTSITELTEIFRAIEELSEADKEKSEAIALSKELTQNIAYFLYTAEQLGNEDTLLATQDQINSFYYKLRLKKKADKLINQELRAVRKQQTKALATEKGLKRIPLTMDDLISELNKSNIEVRENLISHEIEYKIPKHIKRAWGISSEHIANDISIYLKDAVNVSLEYKTVTDKEIDNYLQAIGHKNKYNPLQDLLDTTKWDGKDYWTELFSIMGLADELSKIVLKKWLYQTIAQALFNGSDKYRLFGADGIIVLQGSQGIGKTRTVQLLDPFRNTDNEAKYIRTGGKYNGKVKDTLIQSTSYLITEFGELERTLKKEQYDDTGDFKSFITDPVDEYRSPYGKNSEKHPRKTGFIGTVNRDDFLIDTTGNRRFYTISVEHIDLKQFEAFAIAQLWKQAYLELTEYQEQNGKNWQSIFRLTTDERSQLDKRNTNFEKALTGEDTLQDLIAQAEADADLYIWQYKTVSEIKANWLSYLSRYSDAHLRNALKKMSKDISCKVEFKRSNGSRYYFPVYKGTNSLII